MSSVADAQANEANWPNEPTAPTQLQSDSRHIRRLQDALEPFRHMRVQFDERPSADCEITNLIDGIVCTIGYARSRKEADEFDEIFERVRAVLR
jgi:hypothetical protein